MTSAHELPSSYIIHAVGPIYHQHRKAADKLRSCYRTSLELALEKGEETEQDVSIAFSCLSTGVYGYPSGEAAEVAAWEVRRFLEELERKEGKVGGLERVVFCIFEAKDERAYGEWLPYVSPESTGSGTEHQSSNLFYNTARSSPPRQKISPPKKKNPQNPTQPKKHQV